MPTTPTADDLFRSEDPLILDSPPVIALVSNTSNVEARDPELNQTPATTDYSSARLLSIPAPSVDNHRSSLAISDNTDNASVLDPLSPEITSADITVAPDGSFVETSSGLAARELKRHWDQQVGVGKDVRSPYAITAFVNQHGKSMFRVGPRDLGAPAASSAEVEEHSTRSSEPSTSPKTKRRSRMSMHSFLPQSMFKNGPSFPGKLPVTSPQTNIPRKLRKTRSIPDLVSSTANDSSSLLTSPQRNGAAPALAGRGHSHSVTGADVAPFTTISPIQPRRGDLFGEVVDWQAQASSASTTRTAFSNDPHDRSIRTTIAHPFGPGVTYDSPSRKPAMEFLSQPRFLREMQSFESGRTARQLDPGRVSSIASDTDSHETALKRPPSALWLRPTPSSMVMSDFVPETSESPEPPESPQHGEPPEPLEPPFAPLAETVMISHFPTDVFDVLQTYRGLPLLEKLSVESEDTTVIKMSLSADDTAAPRNDPRFVIWGELEVERDHDDQSVSQDSLADLSVRSSLRRRSTKTKTQEPAVTPRLSSGEGTQKVIIAATIERWIAQLTSDLNYEELLDFFLTYRSYVNAYDLCQLLICRFHWALQQHTSSEDEKVRRVVRVRTFVAIRYWLLTFFTVDFLPNRELRLLLANWLNTLIRDPVLKKLNDGLGIVRRLIKVVKECKKAHTRTRSIPKTRRVSKRAEPADEKRMHLLGEKFAAATRKSVVEDEDSDVDLDFLPDQATFTDSPSGFQHDAANAHLNTAHVGAGLSPTRPASIPFSSFSILQRTDHAPGPIQDPDVPFVQNAAMPVHHSALSRVFVKTIGRLGRWKRVLNSRAVARASLSGCTDVSAFDLELGVSRELLTVNGGVEDYLTMVGSRTASSVTAYSLPASAPLAPSSEVKQLSVPYSPSSTSTTHEHSLTLVADKLADRDKPDSVTEKVDESKADQSIPGSGDRPASFQSSSTDSFGSPLASGQPPLFRPLAQAPWQFDVVSIDDLEFSDTSSDFHIVQNPTSPSGLRRQPRKLPLRRDFEFVRRETVSSLGIGARESVTSNASSVLSSPSGTGLGGGIAQWQLNYLIDSLSVDEEAGDVEGALRRLEGQINPEKQQEKASKVDGWVRTMRERMATGDYVNEPPRFLDEDFDDSDDEEMRNDSFDSLDEQDSASQHEEATVPSILIPLHSSNDDAEPPLASTPMASQTSHFIPPAPTVPPANLDSSSRTEAKPAPEDAVPLEILQSRVPSRPSTASSHKTSVSRFTNSEATRVHHSWILGNRTAIIAKHFAMIDRELFMGVKFDELIVDDWIRCEEVNVIDWSEYLNDRARWRAESRFADKTTALAAVRGRFNLMANFIISEIVLTQPHERPALVAKFIRIAWKSYLMCNFASLVAIIAGLQSEWVTKAMRRSWHRVGIFETRMFKDLRVFTSNTDDFMYIRQIVESIVDPKSTEVNSHATSIVSGDTGKSKATSERQAAPIACIPFIGVYLSQLQRFSKLPDLIDPTAPNEAVGTDPITSNLDSPAHPEVFDALAPLPPSMHLEPLINVHKQRRKAGVIKALVAGQHLASRMQFEVDKKLYQRCLRLRALDSSTLQRVFAAHPE